jgi:hypothetical protein
MKGKGGILKLREIFPNKQINCFRAPFLCWSPPHLEALRDLGFRFDFSTDISYKLFIYRGIKFFPYPLFIDNVSQMVAYFDDDYKKSLPRLFLPKILNEEISVILLHPSGIVENRGQYFQTKVKVQTINELKLTALKMFFRGLSLLRKAGMVNITPSIEEGQQILPTNEVDVKRLYVCNALKCEKLFKYKPKYIYSHFLRFFSATE